MQCTLETLGVTYEHDGATLAIGLRREDGKQDIVHVHSSAGEQIPRSMCGRGWSTRYVTALLVALSGQREVH